MRRAPLGIEDEDDHRLLVRMEVALAEVVRRRHRLGINVEDCDPPVLQAQDLLPVLQAANQALGRAPSVVIFIASPPRPSEEIEDGEEQAEVPNTASPARPRSSLITSPPLSGRRKRFGLPPVCPEHLPARCPSLAGRAHPLG